MAEVEKNSSPEWSQKELTSSDSEKESAKVTENIKQELWDLKNQIAPNRSTPEKEITAETQTQLWNLANEIISKIQQDEDFYKKDADFLHSIGEKLQKKEYVQAFLELIQGLFKGFSLSAKSGFKHLESEIQKLNLSEKSTTELQELISQFEQDIKNQNSSLSDLTDKTFLMSLCKDKALENQCLERQLPAPSPYDKLKYQLLTPKDKAVGKVLLFNVWAQGKGNGELNTMMKKSVLHPLTQSTSGSWFQHAVMISKVDSDGTIYITHANSKGVNEEKLTDYFARDNTMIDVMMLNPPEWYGEKAVAFAQSKLWAKYDTAGMAYDTLLWGRKSGEKGTIPMLENKSDLFYCSELIFEWFEAAGLNAEKSLFTPGDLMKLLTPSYCSSFDCSKLETQIALSDYEKISS